MDIELLTPPRSDLDSAGRPKDAPRPKSRAPRRRSLDSADMQALHGKLMDWFNQERDRQSLNRYLMSVDEDYYDSLQWSEEDANELLERGQAPLVINKIKPAINWLLGTEKKTRMDYKILPREESDEQQAEVKTKLFKYVDDCNHAAFARSDAFADAVIAGLGWLEEGVNTEPGAELMFVGTTSWKNVLHDSLGLDRDINVDGRYLFRWKYLDLDVAQAMFPDRKGVLAGAAIDADEVAEADEDIWYMGARVNSDEAEGMKMRHRSVTYSGTASFGSRQRVKIIEAWYKVPQPRKVMRGEGVLDGELFDETDDMHLQAVQSGIVTLANTLYMEMRCALMTESFLLYEGRSPYRHNKFPLTPVWCYRRRRDNMPYGVIRDIRDLQDDYNKRASKALFILSSNQIIMDSDAVDAKEVDNLRYEASDPNGIIVKKKGSTLEFRQDKQLAEQHLMLMDRDAKAIQDVAGITDENMGRQTNASSGVALQRRQDQGQVVTFNLFDNLRFAIQISGEKRLSLIEQFYTAEKVVRIVGENKPIEWLPINKTDPITGAVLNDITSAKADFIISEQDYRASLRESMFETLMDMLAKIAPVMPQAAINLLDLVVGLADIPNREEFVSRIRALNGQSDPSRKPTPEEIAARQKKGAMEEQVAALNMEKLAAEVSKIKGEVAKLNAEQFAKLVDGMYAALQAAQVVATVPQAAPVADVIAQGAGYKPQGGVDPGLPQPAAAVPQPQEIPGTQQPRSGDQPPDPTSGAAGARAGIETARADGVMP